MKKHLNGIFIILSLTVIFIILCFCFLHSFNKEWNRLLGYCIGGYFSFLSAYIVFYLGAYFDNIENHRSRLLRERPYFDIDPGTKDEVNLVFYNHSESILHNVDVYIYKRSESGMPLGNVFKISKGHQFSKIEFRVKKDIDTYDLLLSAETLEEEKVYFYYGKLSTNKCFYREDIKLKNMNLSVSGYKSIKEDNNIEKLLSYCEKHSK